MNERINDLMMQAQLFAAKKYLKNSEPYEQPAWTEFAEAIVKECIAVARKDENSPAYETVARIAQHFGIEE